MHQDMLQAILCRFISTLPRYLIASCFSLWMFLQLLLLVATTLMLKLLHLWFRDYTNPYLPVAPSAIDGSGQVLK